MNKCSADWKCRQGRGDCPRCVQEGSEGYGEPLTTLESLQVWGIVALAVCAFSAFVFWLTGGAR